jgi:hypothetical protein
MNKFLTASNTSDINRLEGAFGFIGNELLLNDFRSYRHGLFGKLRPDLAKIITKSKRPPEA